MDVTDVLRDRMQPASGLQRMLTVSTAIHLAVAAAIVFAPGGFFHRSTQAPVVMTISLGGGGNGPENGGMTSIGGRPVQEVRPVDEPVKREAARPPAAKTPEMTVPLPNAKATKAPASTVKTSTTDARGRTPTKGDKVTPGTAIAETGARGQGFGLSTGGGAGSGSTLEISGDFCCPEYLTTMMVRIKAAWNQNQGATGHTVIRFTIGRDGSIRDATVFQSSGVSLLDTAALRAVLTTRTLPPLPEAYTNPTLTIRLNFEYQ